MPMTDNTILQKQIASLFLHNLNVEVPSVYDDLIEHGLLDSLKIVELLVELETHFELKIPFEDLEIESFRSVANIARLIASLSASPEMVPPPLPAPSNRVMRFPVGD
jgi:acyl carrier protein